MLTRCAPAAEGRRTPPCGRPARRCDRSRHRSAVSTDGPNRRRPVRAAAPRRGFPKAGFDLVGQHRRIAVIERAASRWANCRSICSAIAARAGRAPGGRPLSTSAPCIVTGEAAGAAFEQDIVLGDRAAGPPYASTDRKAALRRDEIDKTRAPQRRRANAEKLLGCRIDKKHLPLRSRAMIGSGRAAISSADRNRRGTSTTLPSLRRLPLDERFIEPAYQFVDGAESVL